eukprot:TRINITY_DN9236_c0_g1_i1.p1 TRINITY_DN9236_c0_g1~~TRINITY_DN9236_c0_g1_i1.p1  ORF type:complete len:291 (+),score=102.27 TRINITY_DN9236_c0_g1_i1:84-956(+)
MGCSSGKPAAQPLPLAGETAAQASSVDAEKAAADEKAKVASLLKQATAAVPGASPEEVATYLKTLDKHQRTRIARVLVNLDAEAQLRKLFESLSIDEMGYVRAQDLAEAFLLAPPELAALMKDACMNPQPYVQEQLKRRGDERLDWEKFLSLCRLAEDLTAGQAATVASTRQTGTVLRRTTTDVQLQMPDGSEKWFDIEDVRVSLKQSPLAPMVLGPTLLLDAARIAAVDDVPHDQDQKPSSQVKLEQAQDYTDDALQRTLCADKVLTQSFWTLFSACGQQPVSQTVAAH